MGAYQIYLAAGDRRKYSLEPLSSPSANTEKAILPTPSQTTSLDTTNTATSEGVTTENGPVNSEVPEALMITATAQEVTEALSSEAPETHETENSEVPAVDQSTGTTSNSPLQPEVGSPPVSELIPLTIQVDSAVLEASNAPAQAPVSTRATRSQQIRPSKASEAEKKLWTYDAGEYLRETLTQFGGSKLAGLWRDFENCLGNPVVKVRVFFRI
jgi:hypothetical protein